MARNVDGEFEVLLGNKQLVTIFFLVVILLAVFFTIGYQLGRYTAAQPQDAVRDLSQSLPFSQAASEPRPAAAPPEASGSVSEAPPPPAETDQQPPAAPPEQAAQPAGVIEPAAGETYLQVTAGRQAEAQVVVGVLKKNGFRAAVAPGPAESVYRVLVGPLPDREAVAKTRAELEAIGFRQTIIRKY